MKLQLGTFQLVMTDPQWTEVERQYQLLGKGVKGCGMLSIQPIAARGTLTVTVLTPKFSERLVKYLKRQKAL